LGLWSKGKGRKVSREGREAGEGQKEGGRNEKREGKEEALPETNLPSKILDPLLKSF